MPIKINKYSPIIYPMGVLYLLFFFLSPFTHHHHNVNSSEVEVILHSHIVNEHEDNHNDEITHGYLEDSSTHKHNLYSLNFRFIGLSKTLKIIPNNSSLTIINSQVYQGREIESRVNVYLDSKPDLEKYVHFASNLSPPLS